MQLKVWFQKVKQLKHVYVREQLWLRKTVYGQPQTCLWIVFDKQVKQLRELFHLREQT